MHDLKGRQLSICVLRICIDVLEHEQVTAFDKIRKLKLLDRANFRPTQLWGLSRQATQYSTQSLPIATSRKFENDGASIRINDTVVGLSRDAVTPVKLQVIVHTA